MRGNKRKVLPAAIIEQINLLRAQRVMWKDIAAITGLNQRLIRCQVDPVFDLRHITRERERCVRRRLEIKSPADPHSHIVMSYVDPPTEAMFDEAAKRFNAPRSLSAILLGDPPPGYSALDRKKLAEVSQTA